MVHHSTIIRIAYRMMKRLIFWQTIGTFLFCIVVLAHSHDGLQLERSRSPEKNINTFTTVSPSITMKSCRGGAVKASDKRLSAKKATTAHNPSSPLDRKKQVNYARPPSTWKKVLDGYRRIQPVTRSHVTISALIAIVNTLGFPAPKIFSLNIQRLYEIWRPITAATYLGGLNLSFANNLYFLISYGQMLEELNGSAEYAYFLGTQIVILSVFSFLLQFPFTARSLIAAIIYVCSRINAMDSMPFQFGLTITSWQLPFCMMILDCLAQQSAGAAWPHLLGILSGHIYHFYHDIWPRLGGQQRFATPQWLTSRFSNNHKIGTANRSKKNKSKR